MVTYAIYYMRPDFFANGMMGVKWCRERGVLPDPTHLTRTHIHLKDLVAEGLEQLWIEMQGENWSPRGEARPLIRRKGLKHTSMSVGDIAVDNDRGVTYMVDNFGWVDLHQQVRRRCNLRQYVMSKEERRNFDESLFVDALKRAGFLFESDSRGLIKIKKPWDQVESSDGTTIWRQWDESSDDQTVH
jgi:hypothetical protein